MDYFSLFFYIAKPKILICDAVGPQKCIWLWEVGSPRLSDLAFYVKDQLYTMLGTNCLQGVPKKRPLMIIR